MKISNLSKDLGLKKISPLRFREDDNLYKKFQKLAKYIYKNGEWTEDDKQDAAVKAFRQNVRDVPGMIEKIELSDPNIPKYTQTKDFEGEVYRYVWKSLDGMAMSAYMFIDIDNKSGAKHAKRFRQDIFGKTKRINRRYTYNNEGAIYNLDRIIGFNQLGKALLKEFDARQGQLSFSKNELSTYLEILSDPKYAAKKYGSSFSKESRHFGDRTTFIEDYIARVYDISVQREYERKLTSQFRASPAFTKANINAETREVMDKTPLKKYFGFVELDNDVDLEKFKDFEQEMQRIKGVLPEVERVKPDLRLRKLGNYRALGMFIPAFDTIAIDFRSSSTVNGDKYRPINPGISSFVHEYGHFLDHRVPEKNQDLSLDPAFKPILDNYIEQLKVNGIYDVKHGEVDHYYAVPTEVFARSFEIYVHEKGLRSSLLQNNNYSISKEYTSFTPEIRNQLTQYFDKVFPNLAKKITLLNEREANITKDKEKQEGIVDTKKAEKPEERGKDEQQATKKEEALEYTPYLESKTQGSGLPDREDSAQKFDRLSTDNSSKGQAESSENRGKDEQKKSKNEDEVINDTEPKKEFYRFRQAKKRLEKLEREYKELAERSSEHTRLANGQPMNDKRNGASWLKKENWFSDKLKDKHQEIEEQRERVERLELQAENMSLGLTRNGSGLEMSVRNLPRIKEHIEKAERGELSVTRATVRRWKKKVVELEKMKKVSATKFTVGAQKLVDDGLLSQWKKKPTIYFLTNRNYRKLALEINEKGEFEESSVYRYRATTDEAKEYVQNLLDTQKEINANQENITKTLHESKTDTAREKQATSKREKVNAKEIDQAKSENILAVAQHLGIQLLSDKGKYYWEQEPSFVIDPRSNMFTWKEKEIYQGDPVMLVKELKQLSFDEAVKYLNDTQIANFDIEKVKYRLKEKAKIEEPQKVTPEKNDNIPAKAGSVPKRVTKEQITQARNRNILEVAQNLGINLRQAGQTYVWTEHDSFVVFPKTNTYSWFSKDESGKNPIDLVQSFNRVDFKTAVAYLNSADLAGFDETKIKVEPQKPFKYLLKDSADVSKLKEYFEAERGISQTTVRDFLQSGVIAQANRIHQKQFEPVIVFKHKEADGKLVGASLQGIKEDFDRYPGKGRLKEIITNSKRNWGITYNCGLEPEQNSYNLIFFEAPIDMISYYELHKDKLDGTRLVAMNGLKENTIGNHLAESIGFDGTLQQLNDAFVENGLTKADVAERFKKQGGSIKLAVDNDDKGQAFIKKMQEKYPVLPFEAETPPMLAGREKTDWNDYLKATKTGKVEIKEVTRSIEAPVVKDRPKEPTEEVQLSSKEEKTKNQEFSLETATAKEVSNYAMKKIREFSQDPKAWDEYMTALGHFSEYSPRNVALIYAQDKDAKMVGTYNEWQMRHERYKLTKDDIIFDQELADRYAQKGQALEQKLSIRSGEKGKITLFRVAKEWHIPRTDAQGNVILNAEGKPKYKKYHATQLSDLEKKLLKEEKIKPVAVSKRDREGKLVFQKYKVFDISQTNLKKEAYAKVTPKHQYDYDAESSKLYKISYALKDYAKQNKIDYHIDKRKLTGLAPTTKGKYQNDGKNARVLMNKNLDFQESLGTAIRLMSHAVVDNKYQEKLEKFQRGLEAEIIGHAVAAHFGLPTEKRYLKEMSEKLQKLSDKELTASLNRAFTSSNEFIKQIARYSETPKRERDRRVTKKKHTPQMRVI